jgi:ATP-dependent Clp protease ATP-binding subunit ClpC
MEYQLEISDSAIEHISKEGFDPDYGARPLKRAIQRWVEDVLTEEIINSNPEKGTKMTLEYNSEDEKMQVVFEKKKKGRKKKTEE